MACDLSGLNALRHSPKLAALLCCVVAASSASACRAPENSASPAQLAARGGASPPIASDPGLTDRAAGSGSEFVLSVLSLNDLHGKLGALPMFAGYVQAVSARRARDGAVLVLDAGDMFQGTLGSNATQGQAVVEAYNALPLAATALGNHEFDYGFAASSSLPAAITKPGAAAPARRENLSSDPQGALRARMASARYRVLSANLLSKQTGRLPDFENLSPDVLLDVRGVQVGLIGILTEETPSIVRSDYFAGLSVTAAAPAVIASANSLRARGAEVVLVLAHAGGECSRFDAPHDLSSCDAETGEVFKLARALPRGLVDAIVAGHTHAGVSHFENGIAIIEAYSRGKAFGRLDLRLTAKPHRVLDVRPYPPEPLCPDSAELAECQGRDYEGVRVEPSAELQERIAGALAYAREARQRLVGVTLAKPARAVHEHESALGNLFVDILSQAYPGADLALMNGGTLRADLPAGPLSYGVLYESMPFDNGVVELRLTGAELRQTLARHLGHAKHGIVSVSGVRVRVKCESKVLQVELFRPNGAKIRDPEELRVLTSDYLATGGDHFFTPLHLTEARVRSLGPELLRDALARGLSKRKHLDPERFFDPKRPRLELPSARPVRCD